MDVIKNVDVLKIETMAVSSPAAAEWETVVEICKWKMKRLLLVCVCMPTLSLHHVQYVAVCIVDALTVLGDSLLEYI